MGDPTSMPSATCAWNGDVQRNRFFYFLFTFVSGLNHHGVLYLHDTKDKHRSLETRQNKGQKKGGKTQHFLFFWRVGWIWCQKKGNKWLSARVSRNRSVKFASSFEKCQPNMGHTKEKGEREKKRDGGWMKFTFFEQSRIRACCWYNESNSRKSAGQNKAIVSDCQRLNWSKSVWQGSLSKEVFFLSVRKKAISDYPHESLGTGL